MTSKKQLSRSDFLKLSETAALGLALSACNVAQPTATPIPTQIPPTPTELPPPHPPQVTIPGTELLSVTSAIVGQEYRIFVALPDSYTKELSRSYPVLYVLDANITFGMVTDIVRILTLIESLNDVIVVGIGYPVDTFLATAGFRSRDMTPTEIEGWYDTYQKPDFVDAPPDAGTGGAAHFLQFIREELIPVINKTYRTDPGDNGILGHSFGGLFCLYALFTKTDTFKHYLIGSPSIEWDNSVILNSAKEFAANKADISAKVFMSAGGLENDVAAMLILDNLLQDKDKQSRTLKITTHVFDGETHPSVLPAHISRGLRTVYPYYG